MKILQKKVLTILIATLLVTSMAALFQTTIAAVTYYNSYIYEFSESDTIGRGQDLLVIAFTADVPPDIGEAQGNVTAFRRGGWDGIYFNITKPDATNDIVNLGRTDSIGSGYMLYTPSTVGQYSIVAYFPAVWKNDTAGPNQRFYTAAQSVPLIITVQEEPIQRRQQAPVPADYWTRPISQMLHNYYVLEGNWLGGAANQPAGTAGGTSSLYSPGPGPGSAHILWTKPYYVGGLMDARYNETGYFQTHYQGLTWSAIVLNGVVNYAPRLQSVAAGGWQQVDLYTGETISLNTTNSMPSFAQIYNYDSPNQHGGYSYYWKTQSLGSGNGTAYELLDGSTLAHITSIANVSGGTAVYSIDGSILRYSVVNLGNNTNPNSRMTVWNSSAIPSELGGTIGNTGFWQWRPAGGSFGGNQNSQIDYNKIHNGAQGYSANFTIPSVYAPINSLLNQTMSLQTVREKQYAIVGAAGRNNELGTVPGYFMAFSLVPGQEGTKLWESQLTPPFASQIANASVSLTGIYPEAGVIAYHSVKLLTRWGYDMKTGELLWTSEPEPQANYYGFGTNVDPTGKTLYSLQYGGILQAYDLRTGTVIWNFTARADFLGDTSFGNYPSSIGAQSADGKIYISSGTHSPGPIMDSGNVLQCINASNGVRLWNFPLYGVSMSAGNAGSNFVMADGRLLALNSYDNQLYCFGRGPSATTVSAPQTVPALGSSVTITGTVTDQSPAGRRNVNDKMDFSLKGTPAISDADMNNWMQHLFQQAPAPTDAKGVPVTLTAVDPNGNVVPVGETTSDMNGNFGIAYTPEVPGTYQIIAAFAGSEAYGPSSSTTYLTIGEAPVPTAAPTATPTSVADMYFIPSVIGIIVAIFIVGIVLALLLLRKRP